MSIHSVAESVFVPIVPQIQVTLGCNFGCSYCFQDHRCSEMIDPAVAGRILETCALYNNARQRLGRGTVEVYWHGGEPLLAGVEFFREMLGIQATFPGVTFKNHLQTNGSLVTDEVARFLVENRFQVGFSLDGPPDVNDCHRRLAGSRRSAFDATMRGIENYQRHVPSGRVPIIAVVTRQSITRAKEIYSFFKELGAEVQLDIYDLRCSDLVGDRETALFDLAPGTDEVRNFLVELFDLWFNDPERRVDFKELRDELDRVLDERPCFPKPLHKKRCSPGRTIFDPRGLVFECDQYVNDAATALGDIRTDDLATIMRRKTASWARIKRIVRRSGAAMACSKCEWGRSCAGGCLTCQRFNSMLLDARARGLSDDKWPAASVASPLRDIAGETYYCDALRALRAHIQGAVQRELARGHGD